MKQIKITFLLFLSLLFLYTCKAEAQTTYNLNTIWQHRGIDTVDVFGTSLAGGDINKDGFSDIVIGSPPLSLYSSNPYKGTIRIYTDYIDTIADIILTGENATNRYGQYICTGDFNGDEYCDIAVSATDYGSTYEDGKVYVYYGGDPMDTIADWSVTRNNTREYFGCSLASGDINGDKIDDLVIGAYMHSTNNWGDGCVYIYYGDTLGLHTWPDVVIHGGLYDILEHFGITVASGGDLNGDGCDDIIVGADANSESYSNAGKVYIYYGGEPMDTLPDGWIHGEGIEHMLGAWTLALSKINDKTWAAIGANLYPGGYWSSQTNGKMYLLKQDAAWDTIPQITKVGLDTLTGYGIGCFNLSNLSADSLEELGVSMNSPIPDPMSMGQADIILGQKNIDTNPAGYIRGRWQGDWLVNMGAAGDVDGDGKSEVLFSNSLADSNRMVWLCKYTGPDGVAGEPVSYDKVYSLKLGQNYPNPFRQSTVIRYQVTGDGPVKLAVYNVAGQLVKTLTPPNPPPSFQNGESFSGQALEGRDKREGSGSITWDGRDDNGRAVANGVYIYKLNADGKSISKKMIIIK